MMTIFKKYFYTTIILRLNRNLITFLILNFAFLLFTACPEPPEGLDCGPHQIEINGECECEEGYHWNEDKTRCIMDTTSHNFVWEIDTLGGNGSYLMDVAIIDENNVWVGGDIQADGGPYGAAIWDGEQWSLKKLETETSNVRPRGIWAFSDNNIWFASGSIYHWDGNETRLEWLRDIGTGETVEKIWASSQSNIFFVGNEGTIVHYDGVNFEYMESGTDIKLTDIWGVEDQESGEIRVWACGYSSNDGSSVILAYYENQWYTIYERYSGGGNSLSDETVYSPMAGTLWAWEDSDLLWFGGGFGMFALDSALSPSSYEEINIYQEAGYFAYPWRVRGNTPNDLFIVGEYGSVFHYNGINWKWYEDLYQDQSRFRSIAIQSDFAVIVGIDYAPFLDKAYVVRGYR